MHGNIFREMFFHHKNWPPDCWNVVETIIALGQKLMCQETSVTRYCILPSFVFLSVLPFHSSQGQLLVPYKVVLLCQSQGTAAGFLQTKSLSIPTPTGTWHLWRQPASAVFAQTFWAPVKDHLWQDLRKITKQPSPQTLGGMWKPERGHIGSL